MDKNDLPKLAKNSKKSLNYKISLLMMIFTIMLISSVATYAFFTSETKETKEKFTLKTGTMELEFSDNDNGIDAKLFFGDSVTKKFTITNTGTLESSMGIDFYRYKNTYMEGSLTYRVEYSENEDGPYTEILPEKELVVTDEEIKIIPAIETITIPAGKTYYYNLTVKYNDLDIDQTSDSKAIFYTRFSVKDREELSPSEQTLKKLNLTKNEGMPDFSQGSSIDEGIYSLNDEDGASYYFRGASENNYLKFAGYYWRIIRINGNGTLRIIYDGTTSHTNKDNNSDKLGPLSGKWNLKSTDTKHTGYMFGGTLEETSISKNQAQTNETDSNVKTILETWYENNILNSEYANYISDEIFCNDRSTPNPKYDIGYGEASSHPITYFGAYTRIYDSNASKIPEFTCLQDNDKFTVNENKGNGKLKYPIGLITADEALAAGSKPNKTEQQYNYNYLYKGAPYWTMTPAVFNGSNARVFTIDYYGKLIYNTVDGASYKIVPVINLTTKYIKIMIGSGTIDDPFRSPLDNP